ncbi:MAG: transporter [Mycobacterium sp.]|nr:transporter [Mycobacterium sp.]
METALHHAAGDDEQLRQRVVRKVAWRIAPFVGLLFFVNYLDRTNIAFGKLTMSKDLHLTDTQYGLASGLFFIGYLLLEIPSNLALHRFGARRWMARIMLTWGIIASLIAFVPNAGMLNLLRFLLGIAEAGFFPGMILYLTYWFPKRERARATAMFLVAIPASSALGSPLSALLIQHGQGIWGLDGWRFMFLVEGIPSILLAFVTWFFLTDRPAKARWLTTEERDWLTGTLEHEEAATGASYHYPMRKALLSGRTLGLAAVYFGAIYGLYALGFFLPTIIKGFQKQYGVHYSLTQIGLITAIPYFIGAVAMVLWARHADRTNERVWHVAIPLIVGGIAIPITLYLNSPLAAMVAVSICAVGVLCSMPTFWSLPSMFLTGTAAAAGIAMINMMGGSLAGFAAPYITGFLNDHTGSSKTGLWVVGLTMIVSGGIVLLLKATPAGRAEPIEPAVVNPLHPSQLSPAAEL